MHNDIPIDDIVKKLLQHNLLARLEITREPAIVRIVGGTVGRWFLSRKGKILAEGEREKLLGHMPPSKFRAYLALEKRSV